MYDRNNVFYKILRSEIPCKKIYEDDVSLAFYDINPKYKVHALIITKNFYRNFSDFISLASDIEISGFMKSIKKVVDILGISVSGYRLLTNTGENSGQEVEHFHVHILGGEKLF